MSHSFDKRDESASVLPEISHIVPWLVSRPFSAVFQVMESHTKEEGGGGTDPEIPVDLGPSSCDTFDEFGLVWVELESDI